MTRCGSNRSCADQLNIDLLRRPVKSVKMPFRTGILTEIAVPSALGMIR